MAWWSLERPFNGTADLPSAAGSGDPSCMGAMRSWHPNWHRTNHFVLSSLVLLGFAEAQKSLTEQYKEALGAIRRYSRFRISRPVP